MRTFEMFPWQLTKLNKLKMKYSGINHSKQRADEHRVKFSEF